MKRKSKKFQIITRIVQDLKSQLEEKPSEKKIYCLSKLKGPLYDYYDESYSSIEEFMEIKGIERKQIVVFRLASEDPNIEQRRKQSTSIH